MNYRQKIINLLKSDGSRMRALTALSSLNLPDSYIAAGFVRNLIWDDLYQIKTALNDIDVIYYCAKDITPERDLMLQEKLKRLEPALPWSVKNQARMHLKHNHTVYKNSLDAMSFWPEKQTAIGVRLNQLSEIEISHCFDLSFQFNGLVEHNPNCPLDVFENRLLDKKWQAFWPGLEIKY